jgi:NAD(P)-dependent dehydrogenase (short-subunit alcohol dehydrogenase family)
MNAEERKSCVITGASSGIGLAIARRLDAAGYRLALTARNAAGEEKLRRELADFEADHHLPLACDVADEKQIEALFAETASKLGRIDAVVANAGIHLQKPAIEVAAEDWDRLFSVDVRGVMLCCRQAARFMSEHGGSIVVIGSIAAERPSPNRGAYCAAKAAVHTYAQCLALEWAPLGIRVNVVAPGPIDTGFISEAAPTPAARQALEKLVPLGRIGTPDEVAGAVEYLLGNDASYVTGAVLRIDGARLWA